MKLLQYIQLYIESCHPSLSTSAIEKNARCLALIRDFLSDTDVDIRNAQSTEFILNFANYLRDDESTRYSLVTILEILGTLRKFVRSAINKQIIPNLDIFPAVIKRLVEGTEQGEAIGQINMMETSKDVQIKPEAERLVQIITRWMSNRVLYQKPSDPTEYRRQREYDYNLRCASLYLFGLFCYGMDLKTVVSLKKTDLQSDHQYINISTKLLPVSATVKQLILVYNGSLGNQGSPYVFNILSGNETPEEIDRKVFSIKKRISRFLDKEGIALFKNGNIHDDWISLAMECGLQAVDAVKLLKACIENKYEDVSEDILLKANNCFTENKHSLTEEWYMLRIFVSRLTATKLKPQLISSGLLGSETEAVAKVYDPIDVLREKNRSTGNPLSRFLFFKSTQYACALINSMIKGAAVLRDRATGTFAVIRQDELQAMQYMLRDFRDDVELINKTEWLDVQQSKIKIGGRVKILEGALKDREATIVEIKDAKAVEKSYLLEFAEGNITFKTKLTGVKLQVIE